MNAGDKFGKLTLIERAGRRRTALLWKVRCDCGVVKVALQDEMRRGRVVSCGCARRDRFLAHGRGRNGRHHQRTFRSWSHMVSRCENSNDVKFASYGGRGIAVCERWRTFENFLVDMGDRPDGTSIDRIDNSKGYEPGNCRWATAAEQSRNRRGIRLTLDDAIAIRHRVAHGERRADVAIAFGVAESYVGRIVTGKIWKEAEEP